MRQVVDDQRDCTHDQVESNAVGDSRVKVGVHFAELKAVEKAERSIGWFQDMGSIAEHYSPEVGRVGRVVGQKGGQRQISCQSVHDAVFLVVDQGSRHLTVHDEHERIDAGGQERADDAKQYQQLVQAVRIAEL